jgi:hypothetical protein
MVSGRTWSERPRLRDHRATGLPITRLPIVIGTTPNSLQDHSSQVAQGDSGRRLMDGLMSWLLPTFPIRVMGLSSR